MLIQLNEPGGPGEARTAETLRVELPKDWVVIAGKQLVRPHTSRDIDFLIIGNHRVFVCEEKSWAGAITGTTSRWVLPGGESLSSPHDQAVAVTRAVAGHIEKAVPALKQALKEAPKPANGPPPRAVLPRVILSAPTARPLIEDPRTRTELLMLSSAADRMREDDANGAELFSIEPWRDEIIDALADLPDRPEMPSRIGSYSVEEELPRVGEVRQFIARHADGSVRLLRLFPRHAIISTEADSKEDNLLLREYTALQGLRESGRTAQVDPYFTWDVDQFWVVPLHLIQGKTLEDLIRSAGRVERGQAGAVTADAFAALAELHATGLLHRGLAPSAVWVTPGNRVALSDFRLARVPDQQTISAELDVADDPSLKYRAPEVRHSLGFASPASDVFSLGATIVTWLSEGGNYTTDEAVTIAEARLPAPLRALLRATLAANLATRPAAEDLGAAVAREGSTRFSFEPGAIFDKRYRIMQRLGEGATAVSWLAFDQKLSREITLKVIKEGMINAERLRHEFDVLSTLAQDNIPQVLDLWMVHQPLVMACSYVPGSSLKDLGPVLRRDTTRCCAVLIDILNALSYVHSHQILHRDISPGNVIVPEDASAPTKLIDFGLAASSDHAASVVGTPRYRALEVDQHGEWSASADMYSAAAVIFESYTSYLPYTAINGSLRKSELLDPGDERFAGLHQALLRCLLRAVSPDPAKRYSNASEFLAALAQIDLEAPTPEASGTEVINPTVDELRRLYRNTALGNHGNRGLDSLFARDTYVDTRLDNVLTPSVMDGQLALVVLSGNPGDGKTSYLERLAAELTPAGASTVHRDEAGWRLERSGHLFAALFDASESHQDLSADEMLEQVLAPLADYPEGVGPYTALIAANDGRLLDFFERNRAVYPDLWDELRGQIYGGMEPTGQAVVVDLKRRSLVSLDDPETSLFARVLDELVATERWSDCEECIARHQCPIRFNALSLSEAGPDAPRQRLHSLLVVSHLRGERRATLRDLRSALGYLITADQGCEAIHAEVRQGLSPVVDADRLYFTLAVNGSGSPDLLLQDWAALDPATVPSPQVERLLYRVRNAGWAMLGRGPLAHSKRPSLSPGWHGGQDSPLTPAKRRFYFEVPVEALSELGMSGYEELLPYRYLGGFRAGLAEPDDSLLSLLLMGLSRAVGVLGYMRDGLALRSSERNTADGVVVKELPSSDFQLTVPSSSSRFIEAYADHLRLEHVASSAALRIELDQFELLMRVANGYLPTNQEARPVLEELAGFAEELLHEPADRVMIVEPNGQLSEVERIGNRIRLVSQ